MSDDFNVTPLPPESVNEVLQRHVQDIYDPEIGPKTADIDCLKAIVKAYRHETERHEFYLNAMCINGDPEVCMDLLMDLVDAHPEHKFSKLLNELLIDRAQDVIDWNEDYLSEQYAQAELDSKHNGEPIYLDDYRSKKGD